MTENPAPAKRFVLRDLPLCARLVLSLFLLSVGLGYVSAIVQLHFRHAGASGAPLPTTQQVIAIFHGDESQKKSQLERMIEGPPTATWPASMTPAFFGRAKPEAAPDDPEREGERKALLAWVRAGATKASYDAFPLPADWNGQKITKQFLKDNTLLIRSIVQTRCLICHKPGGDVQAEKYPLETFEQVAKYTREGGGPKMSLEALTQSTHAHLLSFSVLYTLTGLIFAFTRFPAVFRFLLAPLVLLAQVADISCWWLARLPGPLGEHFAAAIVITGGVVGVGLVLQIVLSLFDMYDWAGRFILLVLFGLAGVGAYYLNETVLTPFLAKEKETSAGGGNDLPGKGRGPEAEKSRMELMIEGPPDARKWPDSMAQAFFNKSGAGPSRRAPGDPEREGERKALIAWLRAGAPKDAYENDALPLPDDWGNQQITPTFRKGDKLLIRSILVKRCVRCHTTEEDAEDPKAWKYPLRTYEEVLKYARPEQGRRK